MSCGHGDGLPVEYPTASLRACCVAVLVLLLQRRSTVHGCLMCGGRWQQPGRSEEKIRKKMDSDFGREGERKDMTDTWAPLVSGMFGKRNYGPLSGCGRAWHHGPRGKIAGRVPSIKWWAQSRSPPAARGTAGQLAPSQHRLDFILSKSAFNNYEHPERTNAARRHWNDCSLSSRFTFVYCDQTTCLFELISTVHQLNTIPKELWKI